MATPHKTFSHEVIVDLAHKIDSEGHFDLYVTDDGDFAISDGLESPIVVSLFSDRRAFDDEVGDPLRRRGWLGNDLLGVPNDNFGSGIWLYEQARTNQETILGVESEARQALEWMVDESLITHSAVAVTFQPDLSTRTRLLMMNIQLFQSDGNVTDQAWVLADNTAQGALATDETI